LVPEAESEPLPDDVILSMARVECHYMYNDLFFPEDDYLLHNVHNLNGVPCSIVQGRYDVICPAEAAVALAADLPQARLNIVPTGAHSGSEPEMASRLIEAMLELSGKPKA
jgi:proline iminopeptidase